MTTVPTASVVYRNGAIPSLELVNVLSESVSKLNVSGFPVRDLKVVLSLQTWVFNADFTKNVFVDAHVFDARDEIIRAETLTLAYLGPAGGGGDFFLFDGPIYDGANFGPGFGHSDRRPDARKVQYRLYYEVRGTLYSDGLLRQHDLPADQEISSHGRPTEASREP